VNQREQVAASIYIYYYKKHQNCSASSMDPTSEFRTTVLLVLLMSRN
jgi:hypothetical protein